MRVASWLELISMLKIATGKAIADRDVLGDVEREGSLAIDGRPATNDQIAPCRPEVISSSLR